ncbi:MAG: hypothetical protein A3B25_02115 [Candidatus Ryanbacteria bacterium RIFCSPLOWO2_01_FULL_48_26]|uniref:Uncharacterized protein n=1 Tax=Candidatus Ryanbacteria bacterium RIFCSPLOWO2_01_FULL_48_26 TaxID=1802126 RepID=A0A1G2GT65_9BACT|nr:MAG: hypothetical protein A3B25_02115 [Candidatus Ryanbacteria bacterium RIFCSPLOWO2_01_FULL_48_26]
MKPARLNDRLVVPFWQFKQGPLLWEIDHLKLHEMPMFVRIIAWTDLTNQVPMNMCAEIALLKIVESDSPYTFFRGRMTCNSICPTEIVQGGIVSDRRGFLVRERDGLLFEADATYR